VAGEGGIEERPDGEAMASEPKKATRGGGGTATAVMKDRYKFFGEVALEKKFVTPEQLYRALTIQARAKVENGSDKLLGQILLEEGYMNADQVRQVLDVLYPAPG
jgi:hypothetical protein